MNHGNYLRPEDASKILKITPGTLRTWSDAGKITCVRTTGGHRRYRLSDIVKLSDEPTDYPKSQKQSICYARVSTYGQKKDLETQIETLQSKFPTYKCIKDIGSGLNWKRKGFLSLLELILTGSLSELVITHKDRLCRFGFELLTRIVEFNGGKILVLYEEKTSPEQELMQDLISIITVFSSKLYGLRSHSLQREVRRTFKNKKTYRERIQSFENKSFSDGE